MRRGAHVPRCHAALCKAKRPTASWLRRLLQAKQRKREKGEKGQVYSFVREVFFLLNDNFPSARFRALGAPAARGIRTGQTLSHTSGLTGSRRHGATRGSRVLQNEAGASVTGARRAAEPRTTRRRGRPVRTALHLRRPREPPRLSLHTHCCPSAASARTRNRIGRVLHVGEPHRNDARGVLRSAGPARARLQPQRITPRAASQRAPRDPSVERRFQPRGASRGTWGTVLLTCS